MPAEIHEHYDEGDVRTGYTVITRESAWDDETRGRALRLTEYEESVCGCGCGQQVGVAYDKTRAFKVDKFTCYAGRALEQVRAKEHKAAEDTKRPDGWDDGVHYYVVPHDDDD